MSNKKDYEKTNTKGLYIKLNKKTDSDIIALLGDLKNKQGYIKALIREDVRRDLGSNTYIYFETDSEA